MIASQNEIHYAFQTKPSPKHIKRVRTTLAYLSNACSTHSEAEPSDEEEELTIPRAKCPGGHASSLVCTARQKGLTQPNPKPQKLKKSQWRIQEPTKSFNVEGKKNPGVQEDVRYLEQYSMSVASWRAPNRLKCCVHAFQTNNRNGSSHSLCLNHAQGPPCSLPNGCDLPSSRAEQLPILPFRPALQSVMVGSQKKIMVFSQKRHGWPCMLVANRQQHKKPQKDDRVYRILLDKHLGLGTLLP